jgi:outer membrane protein TolC
MNEHSPHRALCSVAGAFLALAGFASGGDGGETRPAEGEPPLTLRRAMELAVARAPQVLAAAAGETEAAAATRVASASPRPELWAATSPGWAGGVPVPVLGQLPAIARVDLRATLFDPSRRADEEVARARWADAGGTAASARLRAARAAAELFSRCLLDDRVIDAAEAQTAARRRASERTEALGREGRLTDLDIGRARLAEAEAREAVAEARSRRELDDLELRGLLGWPAGPPLRLEAASIADLPSDEDGGDRLARARAADPELGGLARADTSLETAVKLRARALSPVIEAAAQYARLYKTADWDAYYPTFQPDSWAVAASVSLPLWTGGRVAAEEARARASLDRVRANRRARERDLELALRRTDEALGRTSARRDLARQRESLAGEALRVGRALAAEGRVDAVEVAEREAAVAEASQDSARADHEWLLARLDRLALLGALPAAGTRTSGHRD